jgi:DnaJ-class molecular chaperone
LLLSFVFFTGSAEAWTRSEWQGIIEATAGSIIGKSDGIAPDIGDLCIDCGGTGKVGDGTVMVKCQTCDGTGKNKKADDKKKESAAKSAGTFQCRGFG